MVTAFSISNAFLVNFNIYVLALYHLLASKLLTRYEVAISRYTESCCLQNLRSIIFEILSNKATSKYVWSENVTHWFVLGRRL